MNYYSVYYQYHNGSFTTMIQERKVAAENEIKAIDAITEYLGKKPTYISNIIRLNKDEYLNQLRLEENRCKWNSYLLK